MYLQELDCTELLLTGELCDDLPKFKGEFLWWLSDIEQSDLLEGGLENASQVWLLRIMRINENGIELANIP